MDLLFDPYEVVTDTGLDRFMLFISDSIALLEEDDKRYDPEFIVFSAAFACYYIKQCRREDVTDSISRKYIKHVKRMIKKRKTTLLEVYKTIFDEYLTTL